MIFLPMHEKGIKRNQTREDKRNKFEESQYTTSEESKRNENRETADTKVRESFLRKFQLEADFYHANVVQYALGFIAHSKRDCY